MTNRSPTHFDQSDRLDDLINMNMVRDSLRQEVIKPESYKVYKGIGQQSFLLQMDSPMDGSLFDSLLKTPDLDIQLSEIQTFSASLRKLMALTDEVMSAGDCGALLHILTERNEVADDVDCVETRLDQFVFVIQGTVKVMIEDPSANSKNSFGVNAGSILYLPKGQKSSIVNTCKGPSLIFSICNNAPEYSIGHFMKKCLAQGSSDLKRLLDRPLKQIFREANKDNLHQVQMNLRDTWSQIVECTVAKELETAREHFIR